MTLVFSSLRPLLKLDMCALANASLDQDHKFGYTNG